MIIVLLMMMMMMTMMIDILPGAKFLRSNKSTRVIDVINASRVESFEVSCHHHASYAPKEDVLIIRIGWTMMHAPEQYQRHEMQSILFALELSRCGWLPSTYPSTVVKIPPNR
jgi:hypothetical protein